MKQTTSNVSEQLSQTFATWQLYCLLYEINVAKSRYVNEATRQDVKSSQLWDKLPNFILDKRNTSLNEEQWRFNPNLMSTPGLDQALDKYELFPRELFKWNRESRRVFHLPHSLQATLAASSFQNITWKDLHWPYNSFIISFEKPLYVKNQLDHDGFFDGVMITKSDDSEDGFVLSLRWLNRIAESGTKLDITKNDVRKIRNFLKNQDFNGATQTWLNVGKRFENLTPFLLGSQNFILNIEDQRNKILTEPEELCDLGSKQQFELSKTDTSTRTLYECVSVTLRLIAGWTLYLESLSTNSLEWHTTKTRRGIKSIGETGVITNPEKICEVIGRGVIQPSEMTEEPTVKNHKGFVRPHWRRGHFKRPRGSLVTDDKTIWIPPKLVRSDLVPLYGIVAGTTSVAIYKD